MISADVLVEFRSRHRVAMTAGISLFWLIGDGSGAAIEERISDVDSNG